MNPSQSGYPHDPADPSPGRPGFAPGPVGQAHAVDGQQAGAHPQSPVAAPPTYRADQAFAPGDGLQWATISGRHAPHRLLTAVLWAVPVGAVGAYVVWRNGGAVAAAMWIAAALLATVGTWVVAELDRRSFGYVERADDLVVTHGVFVKRLIVVPYGRMQFVDVTAGLLERWMGIATVRLHTAAAATDAAIPGLPALEAAHLRDRLAQKGEARSMGL
ncbi:PH domain-containing protein [Actinomadura opuntiae]|uniref:PH domain-containing protein n=1 Tax=Actinomadura sp. OS1-43 TaxID=604315 RepID=UPI00255B305D|nr:PH domain-containing protein [Actinomadura sp. OS1-43]MDL4813807.1 PH domain-containing protein [Actinomadura sp. OS1-43]